MKLLLIAVLTALLLISSNASANDPNTAHGFYCHDLIRLASETYIQRQRGLSKETLMQVAMTAADQHNITRDQRFGSALMVEYAFQVPRTGAQQQIVRDISHYCRITP